MYNRDSDFFARHYIAKVLGCERHAVPRYANLAFKVLDCFKEKSMTSDRYDSETGQIYKVLDSQSPLSLYQFWIIKGIQKSFSQIPRGYNKTAILEERLLKEQDKLSYDYFAKHEQEQFRDWIEKNDPGESVKKTRTLTLVASR